MDRGVDGGVAPVLVGKVGGARLHNMDLRKRMGFLRRNRSWIIFHRIPPTLVKN